MPNESRNASQCAAVRYATIFFLTPHYTYHTWAGSRSCPCRPHVPTRATTKCCYEMKIFLKFLDPKANNKSSDPKPQDIKRRRREGGGEREEADQGLRCELLSKQPRSCLLPGGIGLGEQDCLEICMDVDINQKCGVAAPLSHPPYCQCAVLSRTVAAAAASAVVDASCCRLN